MFLAIIYPEVVFAIAIGQYASAKQSVKQFHRLGYLNWTLRHAFFADMGGLLIRPLDNAPFVVNSYQFAKLVEEQCVEYPNITAEEIWDKSKADTLSRLLSLLQASWLILQLLGRAILRLPTSTLELSAGALVICTFGTFLCWLHKPSDVRRGFVLAANVTTADILSLTEGGLTEPYKYNLNVFSRSSLYVGDHKIKESMRRQPEDLPGYFSNDRINISTMGGYHIAAVLVVSIAFTSSYLIAWHFVFPTQIESLLWRISSLAAMGSVILTWVFEAVIIRFQNGRWRWKAANGGNKLFPTWWVILKAALLYLTFSVRWYMIVESLIGLRKLPVGVFQTFDVAEVFPHW